MKSPPIITYMYWLFDAVSIFPVSLYNCWLSSFSPHIFYCPLLHLSSWVHHLLWLLIKKNIPVKEMQLKSIKRQKENIQDIFFDTLSVFIHKSSGAKTSFLWGLIMENVYILSPIGNIFGILRTIFQRYHGWFNAQFQ